MIPRSSPPPIGLLDVAKPSIRPGRARCSLRWRTACAPPSTHRSRHDAGGQLRPRCDRATAVNRPGQALAPEQGRRRG